MTPRAQRISAHALLSLATLATFARAVPYPLQSDWDDGRFIVGNPDLRVISWHTLASIFSKPHFEAYHPIHLLSYWLDVPWAGPNGFVLHAVNLALWTLAANLLLRVFLELGLSLAPAWIASCACAVHPAQVEAVSWAAGRKDVLAMLFSCLCLLCHLRAQHWADRHAWLARIAYALAALAKTTTLPLPVVMLLADVWLRRRPLKQALVQQLPSLLLGAGLGTYVIALWSKQQMLRQNATASAGAWLSRVVATLGHQLLTALWPSSTSPMYSSEAVGSPSAWAWLGVLGLLAAGWLAYRHRKPRVLFSLSAFAVLMLPVSNAIPMYFPYQDRYLSLPLVALGFGLGAALDAARGSAQRIAIAVGAGLVFLLALRCAEYQHEWQSQLRLWGHAASTQPDAYYAWLKLGEVRRNVGQLDGAIRAYRQLLLVAPQRKLGHAALLQAAALRDERWRRLTPSHAELYAKRYYDALDDPEALRTLASEMLASGHLRALELPLGRSLAARPVSDEALEHAAAVQFEQGRPSLALFYLRHLRHPTKRSELRALAERAAQQLADGPLP